MPRKKRVWQQEMCHHIMFRGVDGRALFFDDQDRIKFLLLLQEATEFHALKVHAFCLMTNHIHLILEPLMGSLSTGVHRFAGRYAQYYNGRHQRRGYVYQGRFRSIIVESGLYLRRLIRYIHLNPLEAGLAEAPDDYQWSSHQAYFGHACFTWLETKRVLAYFGTTINEALIELDIFMRKKVEAEQDAEGIRRALRVGAYGSDEFIKIYVPDFVKDDTGPDHNQVTVEQLVQGLCDKFSISLEQLCSSDKSQHIVNARSVLAAAAHQLDGLSLGDVSRMLRKHHGTVSRLAARVTKQSRLQAAIEELISSFP